MRGSPAGRDIVERGADRRRWRYRRVALGEPCLVFLPVAISVVGRNVGAIREADYIVRVRLQLIVFHSVLSSLYNSALAVQ